VQLTVIGCASASGNAGEAQSGYLVEEGATSILLDCGPGVLERLRLRDPLPEAIVLSHLHPDHVGDLYSVVFAVHDGTSTWRPTVYLPPGGRTVIDELLRAIELRIGILDAFLSIREYRSAGPLAIGGLTLTFARTVHTAHSYLIRVTGEGASMVYSGDTAPCPALADHAAGADLFLCEATIVEGGDIPERRIHLTATEAAQAAREAGVGELVLTHIGAAHREERLAEAITTFPGSRLALPGATYTVQPLTRPATSER
jgi:ribonuclease BN (tRNA processing enzyme)